MKIQKNDKLNKLIDNYNLNIDNLYIEEISNIIYKELDNINENIYNNKINDENKINNENNKENKINNENKIKNQNEINEDYKINK